MAGLVAQKRRFCSERWFLAFIQKKYAFAILKFTIFVPLLVQLF
jgi:hypothetical protein